jgi:hypothetical protein
VSVVDIFKVLAKQAAKNPKLVTKLKDMAKTKTRAFRQQADSDLRKLIDIQTNTDQRVLMHYNSLRKRHQAASEWQKVREKEVQSMGGSAMERAFRHWDASRAGVKTKKTLGELERDALGFESKIPGIQFAKQRFDDPELGTRLPENIEADFPDILSSLEQNYRNRLKAEHGLPDDIFD